MKLTEEAQQDRDAFEDSYSDLGCSCHLNSPCSWCIHPGNPLNQDGDLYCWEEGEEE